MNSKVAAAISSYISSGLMKVPTGMTATQVASFANALAKVIYNYKVATHRAALSAD